MKIIHLENNDSLLSGTKVALGIPLNLVKIKYFTL